MGIFYRTVFYRNINHKHDVIVLEDINQIIDMHEIERGYIHKEELLKHFTYILKEKDITPDSRVVEYISSTYDDLSLVENVILEVK